MPLLDVSDLLSDPDFATTFSVTRSSASADTGGINQVASVTTQNVIGVVQPANSSDLQRLPDAEYQKGALTIFTTFRLISGGAGQTADIIGWNGANYTVMTTDDWSQYGGPGYIKALVTLVDLNP